MNKMLVAVLTLLVASAANATTLVYTPVNPDFGGNPANASGLLAEANAQNGTHAPVKASTSSAATSTSNELTSFTNSLQTAVLDKLTSSLENEIISSNGTIKPGVLTTSNFTITVSDAGGGGVNITTVDNANGQKSTFTISQTGLGL